MPTFENGWICRECWCANRESDERCYRCHAVPERWEMPQVTTFSSPVAEPSEERTKVSSLTGAAVPRTVEPATPQPAVSTSSRPPRLPQLSVMSRLRALSLAVTGRVNQLMRLVRAVIHAPGAGIRFVTDRVRRASRRVASTARSILSHRRAWLTVAWMISALSCALLFSVALRAPLAASLLVVAGVAIFSALTAAIATTPQTRQGRSASVFPQRPQQPDELRDRGLVTPAEHSEQGA